MKIRIFCDGSSLIKKDYYESASAIILTVDGVPVYKRGQFHENGTISKGELYALKLAYDSLHHLFLTNELTDVAIICDSEYIVKSATKWIYNWAKNGWKTSNGDDVKFKDVFHYLYDRYLNKKIRNKNISIYHINSHISSKAESARRKFQFVNDVDISQEEFDMFIKYNNEVDELANYVRENKLVNYEQLDGEDICRRNTLKTKDGKIIIRKRTC